MNLNMNLSWYTWGCATHVMLLLKAHVNAVKQLLWNSWTLWFHRDLPVAVILSIFYCYFVQRKPLITGHPKSRRNDGTADDTAISKYIGRGSRRNSNKLDRATERPTIRARDQRSTVNQEIHCWTLQLLSMVFRRVLNTYRVIIDRLWAVSP